MSPPPARHRPACLPGLIAALLAVTQVLAAGLEWTDQTGHRRAPLPVPSAGVVTRAAGFMLLRPADTGITFTNRLAEERSLTNQVFLNGSGVACGDVTGDGLPDLYFCGLDGPNALYRNLGQGRFEDITAAAGVACTDQASTGAAFADLDGDGHLDLLVTGLFRGVRLFLNEGTGRFREATAGSGLESTAASTSLALADVDGDGLLDLYVVNYRNDTLRDLPGTSFTFGVTNGVRQLLTVNGRSAAAPDLAGRFTFDEAGGVLENGEPDTLFRNLGQARFEAIPWTGGAFRDERGRPVETPHDWGLSAMFRDLNRDGAPDLYVCNDFQSPDRIWINDGNGRFQAIVRSAIRETSLFSMGVDFADIDRDGHDDLFVADMLSREHVRRQVQVMGTTAMSQSRLGTAPARRSPATPSFGTGATSRLPRSPGWPASRLPTGPGARSSSTWISTGSRTCSPPRVMDGMPRMPMPPATWSVCWSSGGWVRGTSCAPAAAFPVLTRQTTRSATAAIGPLRKWAAHGGSTRGASRMAWHWWILIRTATSTWWPTASMTLR